MIKELIILADELDRCNEKEAADIIDNLIKMAEDEEQAPPPPQPEALPSPEASDLPDLLTDWFMQHPNKNSVLIQGENGKFYDINRPKPNGSAFITPIKYVQKADKPYTVNLKEWLSSLGQWNFTHKP